MDINLIDLRNINLTLVAKIIAKPVFNTIMYSVHAHSYITIIISIDLMVIIQL